MGFSHRLGGGGSVQAQQTVVEIALLHGVRLLLRDHIKTP
jgi:hypothetical protein